MTKKLDLIDRMKLKLDKAITQKYFKENLTRTVYEFADLVAKGINGSASDLAVKLSDFAVNNYSEKTYNKHKFDIVDAAFYLNVKLKNENNSSLTNFLLQKTEQVVISFSENFRSLAKNQFTEYKGRVFSVAFGIFYGHIGDIDFSICHQKLSSLHKDKMLYFRSLSSNQIDFPVADNNMLLTNDMGISLYFDGQQIKDVNSICNAHDLNFVKEAPLTPQKQEFVSGMLNRGINLFNKTDSFFNDKCVPFQLDGKDQTLNVRRSKLYMDPKQTCVEAKWNECTIQHENGAINCNCKAKGRHKKADSSQGYSLMPQTNSILFKCYGRFVEGVSNISEVSLLLSFTYLSLFCASFYMNFRVNFDLSRQIRIDYLKNDLVHFDASSMDVHVYFEEVNRVRMLLSERMKQDTILQRNANFVHLDNLLPLHQDLENLSVEESLLYDYRTNFEFFCHLVKTHHSVANTFFYKSLKSPVILRVWFFMLEINMGLFLSAFFVSDNQIEDFNLFESIWSFNFSQEEFLAIAYTIIITKVVVGLLELIVSFSDKKMTRLLKDVADVRRNYPVRGFDHFMRQVRCKFLMLLVILIILNSTFAYFLIIFSEIYANSKAVWLRGVLINFFIDFCVVKMTVPILVTLTRIAAWRDRRFLWTFKVSKTIMGIAGYFSI